MIKGKLRKTVLRRDSASSSFRSEKTITPAAQPAPRTSDDESMYIHTARLKPVGQAPFEKDNANTVFMGDQRPSGEASTAQQSQLDEFIDRLNLDKATTMGKDVLIKIINKILSSQYINSVNDGKVHIHSFGLGVGVTAVAVLIQPFLTVYLSSWAILLGRLFKHLIAWLVVGGVLMYILNPRNGSVGNKSTERSRHAHFQELQYSVKSSQSSRDTSPKRNPAALAPRRPIVRRDTEPPSFRPRTGSHFGNQDQQALMDITENSQALERARYNQAGPKTGYDRFMDGALKKEEEQEKYRRFVEDNRDGIKRQSDYAFGSE